MMTKFTHVLATAIFMMIAFVGGYAFADGDVIAPQDFFAQVLQAIHDMGGLKTVAKISMGILLVIASMKVSLLKDLVWSKLGAAQAWVAPVLGLIAGVLGIGADGTPVTVASVMAYVAAGGGAVLLHELLDTVKAIPGIGHIYLSIISIIQSVLKGK